MLNNGQVNYAGTTFTLGQPTVPNAITNGAVYTLPAQGNYSNVYLIGAAIAAQANVPFILTYSDGNHYNRAREYERVDCVCRDAGETVVATMAYANNQCRRQDYRKLLSLRISAHR